MVRVRVRQHVNPLGERYQSPITPPDWSKIYTDINQPLHLDIGCAKGRFLLKMATVEPDWNYLGLEIRETLVEEANEWNQQAQLENLHYLFCNANNSLNPILSSLPVGTLQRVTIQFPDPWFRNRHAKRRVVQPEMLEVLAKYLVTGGVVFVQSDVEAIAVEMRDRFSSSPAFQRQGGDDWLDTNPLPVPTEREISTLSRGEPVYRALFIRS